MIINLVYIIALLLGLATYLLILSARQEHFGDRLGLTFTTAMLTGGSGFLIALLAAMR